MLSWPAEALGQESPKSKSRQCRLTGKDTNQRHPKKQPPKVKVVQCLLQINSDCSRGIDSQSNHHAPMRSQQQVHMMQEKKATRMLSPHSEDLHSCAARTLPRAHVHAFDQLESNLAAGFGLLVSLRGNALFQGDHLFFRRLFLSRSLQSTIFRLKKLIGWVAKHFNRKEKEVQMSRFNLQIISPGCMRIHTDILDPKVA